MTANKVNTKPEILIVEDESVTREVLESRIQSLGYKCKSARNPAEAKKLIKENNFKLVITDIMMPNDEVQEQNHEIDAAAGYKFGCELSKENPELKIICLTGRADDEIEQMVRSAHMDQKFNLIEFFRKPFANQAFKVALEQAMKEHK